MNPLRRRVIEIIRRDGPISVERYMALCLADPEHGYYVTRDPIGAAGDFITAPEISQMFGELIGVWIVSAWDAMGQPDEVNIVELGPGRGVLMSDALRAMRAIPELFDAARVHLVEISPALRDRQRAALAAASAPVAWHAEIATIPEGPMILIANEFFDALPIRQHVKTTEGWRERRVACDENGALLFAAGAAAVEAIAYDAPTGAICETSPAACGLVRAIAQRLKTPPGAGLIIDYGHAHSGPGETLQAMQAHGFVDPLIDPGLADLTAHVDFAALAAAAADAGAATQGPATQASFLHAMGIEARAAALAARATALQRRDIDAARARLLDTTSATGMGALFKAVALRAPSLPPMPGFNED